MKKLLSTFLMLFALAAVGAGQSNYPTIRTGANLPSSCSPNGAVSQKVFYKTGASSGLYQCLATNTWTIVAGSVSSPTSLSATYSNSLATAVTSIAGSPTTLPITQNTTCSTAITVPATLILRFENGAKISKASTCTITFQGVGIDGDPQHQIFNGFSSGNVTWTNVYPSQIRPEWFGAVGDNVTDDLAAFNATIAAFGKYDTIYYGGHIELTLGRTYYLSNTLHIRRSVKMDVPTTRDVNLSTTTLRFPANTKGIVIHGRSTWDGTAPTPVQTGESTHLEGFGIKGAIGGNNTVLSTSGLTMTLTGGSITTVSKYGDPTNANLHPSVPPGTVITVNGFQYVVGDTISNTATSNIPIEQPKVWTVYQGGIFSSSGYSFFPSGSSWVGATVTLTSSSAQYTRTIASHTTQAMTFVEGYPAVDYYVLKVQGLPAATGQNARINLYHGIDVKITSKLKNLTVNGFAGDGVEFNSEAYPSSSIGTEPNSNNSFLEQVYSTFNEGNGFLFWGINSNNIETHSIDAQNNHGYGVYENGTAGSNHFAWHNAYNWRGSVKMVGSIATNNLQNVYAEGDQAPAETGLATQVTNGRLILDPETGIGPQLGIFDSSIFSPTGYSVKRDAARYAGVVTPKAWGIKIGDSTPGTILGFGAGEEGANTSQGYASSTFGRPAWFLSYNRSTAGWYSLAHTNGSYATETPAIMLSGSQAVVGGGKVAFPAGFRTQTGDAQVLRILSATSALDFNLTSVTSQDLTVAVTGAALGDVCDVGAPHVSVTADTLFMCWVSAADTATVRALRVAGTPNPASGTFRVQVTKF